MPTISTRLIHFQLHRSLMADHRLESERIEALKLVRCFVTTKEGMQHVSDSVLRAVIAVAEQTDEKLRNACLETLGEMSMSKRILCKANAKAISVYDCEDSPTAVSSPLANE